MLARLAELPLLIVLLAVTGALCLIPAVHAIVLDDNEIARDFFYSALILLGLSVMLGIATAGYSPRNPARNQLTALAGAFLLLPVAMALPLAEAVPDTALVNAWFEMIASFTTTGASAYPPERLAPSVHLWRALCGWYGGYLILLAAYAILAPLNLGGAEVASGRVPGRGGFGQGQMGQTADPSARLMRLALQLLPVYAALTLVLWIGLLIAGEDATTALIHAMGTLSTSGITGQVPLADSGAGLAGEVLIAAFLIFAITRRAWPGDRIAARRGSLARDPELRLAGAVLILVTLLLVLRHWVAGAPATDGEGPGALASAWGVFFTAASFLTTTGYVSADWQTATDWSGIGTPGMILMALAIIGGGAATTAGGVKLLRVYALLRHGERELERIVHPSSVTPGGAEARRLYQDGAQLAWVFFILFAAAIGLVTAVLTLQEVGFEQALVLAIAMLTTTGSLADYGGGAPIDYAALGTGVKLTLGFGMIVGRLETLALLALILPARQSR
jgi:trk system potassium uptake protein TrkH